ncbi:hypothetical protein [Corynebacterium sp.]|nr:hypothetical protein [Corynebacterium sp.]
MVSAHKNRMAGEFRQRLDHAAPEPDNSHLAYTLVLLHEGMTPGRR